jgi:hypothetical protein
VPDLNNHHSDTLTAIFQHPVSHNIRWHDVLSLLEAVGTVEEEHDGKFKVRVGDETEVLSRPKGHDVGEQMVVDLRRMLGNAGYAPGNDGRED